MSTIRVIVEYCSSLWEIERQRKRGWDHCWTLANIVAQRSTMAQICLFTSTCLYWNNRFFKTSAEKLNVYWLILEIFLTPFPKKIEPIIKTFCNARKKKEARHLVCTLEKLVFVQQIFVFDHITLSFMKNQHPLELFENLKHCESQHNNNSNQKICLTGNIGIFHVSKKIQTYETYGQINGQNAHLYFQKHENDSKFTLFKHEHTNTTTNLEQKVCNVAIIEFLVGSCHIVFCCVFRFSLFHVIWKLSNSFLIQMVFILESLKIHTFFSHQNAIFNIGVLIVVMDELKAVNGICIVFWD